VQSHSTALVLGCNGQDGVLLTKALNAKGVLTVGAGRQERMSHPEVRPALRYVNCDIREVDELHALLSSTSPDMIFHVAAIHGSSARGKCGQGYEAVFSDMLAVNTASVQTTLEYIRTERPHCKLVYASSGLLFGPDFPAVLDEAAAHHTRCLYTVTKESTQQIINYYRENYGLWVTQAYLFNHESVYRGEDFFVPKICAAIAAALDDPGAKVEVNTLNFVANWGSAEEYMGLLVDLTTHGQGEDVIVGHPTTWHARDFVRQAFNRFGLDADHHVAEKSMGISATKAMVEPYKLDLSRLANSAGRIPQVSALEIVESMVAARR
jgi:GDPmannose 4,6-dehydratase